MLKTRGIVDGFAHCLGINEFHFGDYRACAIEQLAFLRQAKTYRPYMAAVPGFEESSLPAKSNFEAQVSLKPGTWIWGLSFMSSALLPNIPDMSLKISDDADGIPLTEQFEFTFPFSGDGNIASLIFVQINPGMLVLNSPLQVVNDIRVQVCNLSNETRNWQLILFCCEPYEEVRK